RKPAPRAGSTSITWASTRGRSSRWPKTTARSSSGGSCAVTRISSAGCAGRGSRGGGSRGSARNDELTRNLSAMMIPTRKRGPSRALPLRALHLRAHPFRVGIPHEGESEAMKRIAVLTSGGDAPGMNAALRAVVRVGVSSGLEVAGVRQGYTGLIEGQLQPLGPRDVASIIHVGGTMLGSARSAEFRTPEGRKRALQVLEQNRLEGLVVIGGNGSLSGAHALSQAGFPVVGVASTIDNDLNGADITIGVDTALNTALEAIDRLKTTATSHGRAGGGPARRREVRRLHSAREGTDLRPAARARAHPQAATRSGAGETGAAAGTLVTRRATEAAARRLPLKRQGRVSSLTRAES